jgi:hypothetical protein
LLFCSSAFAQFVSREQIVEALTTQPASLNFTDRLRPTRSLTLKSDDYVVASVQPKATIDLHEVFFKFNSAVITDEAKPQLRELGAALSDPRLKGSIISIGGHTDAVGSDAFKSWRRLDSRTSGGRPHLVGAWASTLRFRNCEFAAQAILPPIKGDPSAGLFNQTSHHAASETLPCWRYDHRPALQQMASWPWGDCDHVILTLPPDKERAPYFAAFVASSCTITASA